MGLLITFVLGLFILIGVFLVKISKNTKLIENLSISVALGCMISLAVSDLFPEIYETFSNKIYLIIIFVVIGVLILKLLDIFIPEHDHEHGLSHECTEENLLHIGIVSTIAIVLHNIIEGMAVYSITTESVKVGLLMALGVGLHNIPMGMVIYSTLKKEDKKKRILMILLSTISTFIGGLLMALISSLISDFVIGILLNSSALSLLLIAIFSKKLLQKLIDFVVKIMKKLKIKNVEQKQEKIQAELSKYHNSSDYIKNNKFVILKIIITTYIEFLALYSVSYWVYCSFGLKGENILKIISIQSVLYGTVSGIPSPGAVGVTEGGFIEIFKTVFPQNIINGAMILNRGINFYLLIIVSAIITMINAIKCQKMEEKNTENNNEKS